MQSRARSPATNTRAEGPDRGRLPNNRTTPPSVPVAVRYGPHVQRENDMAEARYGSSRDIPGRKREYETIYILRPDIANEAVGALNTKVRGVIEAGQGTLLKVENWGKRRLAYEVQKQMK